MARIRHIAIGTDDPEATAKFYMEGLGLEQVGRVDSPTAEGYYLSDGHVNMAILKWRQEWASVTEGSPKRTGFHHIGFGVEDMDSAQAQVLSAGAVEHVEPKIREEYNQRRPDETGGGNVEVKFTGPDGVTFDLSVPRLGRHRPGRVGRSSVIPAQAGITHPSHVAHTSGWDKSPR